MTKDQAIAKAAELVAKYSSAKNVQDLIEIAGNNNEFKNETEMLIVWGRVCRLLPQKVSA